MIVRCRTAKGRRLPPGYRGLYFTDQTAFSVTPGQSYDVYEMALFNLGLVILLVDDDRLPNWYPIELFDVEDGSLSNWLFALREDNETGTQAVWGHPRLVGDPDLDSSLANGDYEARVTFWREVVMQPDCKVS